MILKGLGCCHGRPSLRSPSQGSGQTSSSVPWRVHRWFHVGHVKTHRDRRAAGDAQGIDSQDFFPQKKMKLRGTKDLSIAAVGKYGTLQEFSFFDKVSVWAAGLARCTAAGRGLPGGEQRV